MAGFREFVTGEVLTAANVDDFLAKQAVMKFADAAARDAALGTAVVSPNALREGMVAWLDDTDSVIAYDGSAWNAVGAEPPAGIGSNVVQAVKTDTFTSAANSYTNITGLSVTVTPSLASSKILLVAQLTVGAGTQSQWGHFRFSGGNSTAYVGAAAGTRTRAVFGGLNNQGDGFYLSSFSMVYVDSPATTSPVTYVVQGMTGTTSASTFYINRSQQDENSDRQARGASSLLAIEVAA